MCRVHIPKGNQSALHMKTAQAVINDTHKKFMLTFLLIITKEWHQNSSYHSSDAVLIQITKNKHQRGTKEGK